MEREELLNAEFALAYGMKGAVTLGEIPRLRKRNFTFFLERLLEQKKAENEAMEKAKSSVPSAPAGNMKYLGK